MAKRRPFTPEFKFGAVLDVVRREKTGAQICCKRNITKSLLYKWHDACFERPLFLPTSAVVATEATHRRKGWLNWSCWWGGKRWKSRY